MLSGMRAEGDGARGLACKAAILAGSCWGVPASWCQAQGRVLVHGEGTLDAGSSRPEACREWVVGWGVLVIVVACRGS